MFPGQGSQSVGMGGDLYKNFELVKKIFKQADEKLNFSISKIILDGPDSELKLTKNTQHPDLSPKIREKKMEFPFFVLEQNS